MDEYFASIPVSNSTVACVGGITRNEMAAAQDDGLLVDGTGYYLFLANQDAPKQPIEILAKFISEAQAERFARLIQYKAA